MVRDNNFLKLGGEIKNMEIVEIIGDFEKWDELVNESRYGTIFQSSDWLNTISDILNKNLKIYGCFENGRLVGGCSIYINNLKFLKKGSSTATMTPYGGILLREFSSNKVRENEQIYNMIIKLLLEAIDIEQLDSVDIISPPGFIDLRPFFRNGWNSKILYTYHLKLDMNIEKEIPKRVRWTIKKAIKNNIVVKKLTDPSIFYELFSMTFERQGLKPPVTRNFLEKIIDLLVKKKIGEMWIAETTSSEVISAEIIVYDNKRAYRWAAASHTDFKNFGGTSLLLYNIFQNLIEREFKEINLMAANSPHLTKFISGFNPILVPYYEIEKSKWLFKIFRFAYSSYKSLWM